MTFREWLETAFSYYLAKLIGWFGKGPENYIALRCDKCGMRIPIYKLEKQATYDAAARHEAFFHGEGSK